MIVNYYVNFINNLHLYNKYLMRRRLIMNEIESQGVTCIVTCAAVCGTACLLPCMADGPVILADAAGFTYGAATGGTNRPAD